MRMITVVHILKIDAEAIDKYLKAVTMGVPGIPCKLYRSFLS